MQLRFFFGSTDIAGEEVGLRGGDVEFASTRIFEDKEFIIDTEVVFLFFKNLQPLKL